MEIKLQELKKVIPHKWRVQSFSKNKPSASCVGYIDARDVMTLLDEVCGAENWQSDFKDVSGQIYGGIGIKVDGEWVWKWDTGAESNIEKEKGEASDAFKRAGVKWGIGRFLYDLKVHYVKANKIKGDSDTQTHAKFPYVIDEKGNRIWDLTEFINGFKN